MFFLLETEKIDQRWSNNFLSENNSARISLLYSEIRTKPRVGLGISNFGRGGVELAVFPF